MIRTKQASLLEIILKAVNIFSLICILLLGMNFDTSPYTCVLIIVTNVFMIVASYKNFLMFILTFVIGYSNYSIIYANYFSHIDDMYTEKLTLLITNTSLNILFFFNVLFFSFIKWNIPPSPKYEVFNDKRNESKLVVYILSLLLIVIFFTGYNIPEFGQEGSAKPIYEYAIVLFILYFYFSGDNKKYQRFGFFLIILYSLQNFVFGGRILGIQFFLCAYIYLYMNKIKMKYFVASLFGVFGLFSIIGSVRGALLSGNYDIMGILSYAFSNGMVLDTAYSAYYASESFLYLKSLLQPDAVLSLFVDFIKAIFIGSSDEDIRYLSQNFVYHTGGGIYPFFFYFYLNIIGVLIFGYIIALYTNLVKHLNNSYSGLTKCIAVFFVCHAFRWYLYSPIGIFRAVLFLCIIYYCMNTIHGLKSKKIYENSSSRQ